MSARSMRKLRGDHALQELAGLRPGKDDNDDNEKEEESTEEEQDDNHYEDDTTNRRSAFVDFSSDDEDETSSEEEASENAPTTTSSSGVDSDEKKGTTKEEPRDTVGPSSSSPSPSPPPLEHESNNPHIITRVPPVSQSNQKEEEQADLKEEEEEDLDRLLDEFRQKDEESAIPKQGNEAVSPSDAETTTRAAAMARTSVITQHMEIRALNLEWSRRHALAGGGGENRRHPSGSSNHNNNINTSRSSASFLFGAPPNRQVKPPSLVGGGMGMTTYNHANPHAPTSSSGSSTRRSATTMEPWSVPWPYNTTSVGWNSSPSDWYVFVQADSLDQEVEDYHTIQNTGDPNALLLFVIHHPFVTPALLQLATLFQQVNQNDQALHFLKRCLWVYECASLVRFSSSSSCRFMDWTVDTNRGYFESLYRLIQVSRRANLWTSSWALSQYLLALDPLRDPYHLLAVVDSFALSCRSESAHQWILDMVEGKAISILLRQTEDDHNNQDHDFVSCDLVELPNWAFSYALALFHIRGSDDDDDDTAATRHALCRAIATFPSVVGLLLEAGNVDVTGRSCRRDWMPVLDQLATRHAQLQNHWLSHEESLWMGPAVQASDKVIRCYVQLSAQLWGDTAVQQLLYDCSVQVTHHHEPLTMNSDKDTTVPPLPLPMARYVDFNSSMWDTQIAQLPPEANVLDPGLVAQAMVVEPHRRPRLLRRMQQQQQQQQQGGGPIPPGLVPGQRVPPPQPRFLGPPTGVIDPDLPLVELLWRSILPWNHVDGVRRGER